MSTLSGLPLVVSPILPVPPSTGEWARRLVRHGMADVLAWLGEDVGPTPDAVTHAIVTPDGLIVSREFADLIRRWIS